MNMTPNLRRWLAAVFSVFVLVALTQCASTVERRIQRNPALYSNLSESDKALVRQGRLREGMGKDAVFLALGRPDRVSTGRKSGKDYERWTYLGQQAVRTQSFGVGYGGWGGWGGAWCGPFYDPFFYGGPTVTYIPYEAAWVDFVNGKAAGWERTPYR